MRLDKCLEKAGLGSRGQIKKCLLGQQVRIDGQVVTKSSQIVDPDLQVITLNQRPIKLEGAVYYLLNKPKGVVTAVSDSHHQTVIDLVAKTDRRLGLYPVGRLDRDTEGLVLLTNNGPLGFRLLHPKHHVTKVYDVTVNGYLAEDAYAFFAKGVVFRDGTICQPATLSILTADLTSSRARLTLSEGKFHQVKKMFLAYGVKVTALKRLAFGPFELDNQLVLGSYRSLTSVEKTALLSFFD